MHCNTIYLLSECEPMEVIIQRRFLDFANSLQNNEVLITIANVAKNNTFSTFGCNYVNSLTNNIHECIAISRRRKNFILIRLEN